MRWPACSAYPEIALDELNRSMADLATALENADSAVALTVANSLWCRKGFELRPDFLRTNTEFYRAETASLDFSDPGAPRRDQRLGEPVHAGTHRPDRR